MLPAPTLSSSIEAIAKPPSTTINPLNDPNAATNVNTSASAINGLSASILANSGNLNLAGLNANMTLQSLQSLGNASISISASGTNVLPKTATFLNQLEVMMTAVKKEASALEAMKLKLKEMEDLKGRYQDVKKKLQDTEQEVFDYKKKISDYEHNLSEMRQDMQKLNDLFTSNSLQLMDTQSKLQKSDAEVANLKLEKDYLLKENEKLLEYKKAGKNLKIQYNSLKQTLEDEKNSFQAQIADWQTKFQKSEKSKSEISNHVYQLTEEIEKLKASVQDKQQAVKSTESLVREEKDKFQTYRDRSLMIIEDLKQRYELKLLKIKKIIPENSSLTIEIVKLQQLVNNKTEENSDLLTKANLIEEKYTDLKRSHEKLLQGASDHSKELQSKLSGLMQENNSLKQKFIVKQNENETLQNDLLTLKSNMSNQENSFQIKEMELSNALKSVNQQKEEFSYKLTQVTAQYDTLNNSYKQETAKYWEELHKLKANENTLLEENERLTSELQQINLRLHFLENENLLSQKQLENKSNDNHQIVATLKEELEKRVNELMNIRSEKESLAEREKELSTQLAEFKLEYSKLDGLMKKTLEAEKTKYQKELAVKTNRVKTLENEKGELLSETHELMTQLTEKQKEITIIKNLNEEKISSLNKVSESLDLLRLQVSEKNKEIGNYQAIEKDLKDKLAESQNYLSSEMSKYDGVIKDLKKGFSQQVLELNQTIQQLLKENESVKAMVTAREEAISSMEKEKEKVVTENSKLLSKNNEINELYNQDVNNLRKEILELRNKYKIVLENKNLLEKEILNLQRTLSSQDLEKGKYVDNLKSLENSLHMANEKLSFLGQQNDHLTTTNTQLVCKTQEMESHLNHKNLLIDNLQQNLSNLEKDSILEIKRLKLIISSHENEINEQKSLTASFLKEINEYKSNLSKITNNNQNTVQNIMDEMKKTEELLMKERKARAKEQDDYFQKSKEYEMNLELLQKSCQDITNNYKTDLNKLEMKMSLLEQENERLKSQCKEKDLRMEEVENSSFAYRKKILESKEKTDLLESDLQEFRTKYENEVNLRKRLEQRVKQLSEQQSESLLESSAGANSVANLIPPRSRGGYIDMDGSLGGGNPYDFSSLSARGNGANRSEFPHNNSSNNNNNGGGNDFIASNSMKNFSLNSLSGDEFSDMKSAHSVPTLPLQYATSGNNNNYPSHSSNLTIASDLSSQYTRQTQPAFQSPARPGQQQHQQLPGGNQAGAASPAVDRVSAALALKLAQQQRSFPFPVGNQSNPSAPNINNNNNSTGNNNNNGSNSNSGAGMMGGNSQQAAAAANRFSRPASSNIYQPASSNVSNSGGNFSSSSSFSRAPPFQQGGPGIGGMGMGSYNDDILAADYDNNSNNSEVGYSNGNIIYPMGGQVNSNSHHHGNGNGSSNAFNEYMNSELASQPSNAVEESIRRAQEKINRKLGKVPSSGDLGTPAQQQQNRESKTPNSGRSANKLHETIQQAHSLYPASPSHSFEKYQPPDDLARHIVSNNDDLSVPSVKPLSPPEPIALPYDSGLGSGKFDDFTPHSQQSNSTNGGGGGGKKKKGGKKKAVGGAGAGGLPPL